jgi:MerR family transcriptional regulator, copper efflux regulator
MNIGAAARASGVSAKMIRYYEEIGLMPPVRRSGNGYRVYSVEDVHTLGFIHRARKLGFPVARIGQLLRLWQDKSRASQEVKAIAEMHIAELTTRIEELEAMRRTLEHLSHACQGNDRPDCPILDDLAGTGALAASLDE